MEIKSNLAKAIYEFVRDAIPVTAYQQHIYYHAESKTIIACAQSSLVSLTFGSSLVPFVNLSDCVSIHMDTLKAQLKLRTKTINLDLLHDDYVLPSQLYQQFDSIVNTRRSNSDKPSYCYLANVEQAQHIVNLAHRNVNGFESVRHFVKFADNFLILTSETDNLCTRVIVGFNVKL